MALSLPPRQALLLPRGQCRRRGARSLLSAFFLSHHSWSQGWDPRSTLMASVHMNIVSNSTVACGRQRAIILGRTRTRLAIMSNRGSVMQGVGRRAGHHADMVFANPAGSARVGRGLRYPEVIVDRGTNNPQRGSRWENVTSRRIVGWHAPDRRRAYRDSPAVLLLGHVRRCRTAAEQRPSNEEQGQNRALYRERERVPSPICFHCSTSTFRYFPDDRPTPSRCLPTTSRYPGFACRSCRNTRHRHRGS